MWKIQNDFGEMTVPSGWEIHTSKQNVVDTLRRVADMIESGHFINGDISIDFSRGMREVSIAGPSEYKRLEPDKEWDVSLNMLVTYIPRASGDE